MKTYDERLQSVLSKIETKKKHHRTVAAGIGAGILALAALVLFFPHRTTPRSVSMYSGSPYYHLIQQLNEKTFVPSQYKNNFDMLFSNLRVKLESSGTAFAPVPMDPMEDGVLNNDGVGNYQEVTDNQVAGVIESDIFKRSDRYLYYIRNNRLVVYSIEGESSHQVGAYALGENDDSVWFYGGIQEMYLSEDCTTVTVIAHCALKEEKKDMTCVRTLDVTDPANIRETGRIFVSGHIAGSRVVNGKLLLMSWFRVANNPDFSKEDTFLPQIGLPGQMQSIAAENIMVPEELTSTRYTVVCLLDSKTLELSDSAAFLSYSEDLYVSRENIFATRSYIDMLKLDSGMVIEQNVTEITGLTYGDGSLEFSGSVKVAGTIKDQYSMDELDGVLRVVTSTNAFSYMTYDGNGSISNRTQTESANLYCIRLDNWEIAAQVESFAPQGESAQSVRFDGYNAYVCTAKIITMTDPVYYFDLSDLSNITWKDTGTIDGYSTSLIQLGDGFLLGIGYNEMRQMKVEVYEETATGVESVCSYEADGAFSEVYKSYLVDRENRMIGFGMNCFGAEGYGMHYILLRFNGYSLQELVKIPVEGSCDQMRAVVIDGYLYVLGDHLWVEKLV